MSPQEFNFEMDRLNAEHRGYYGSEKLKILWSHLRDVSAIKLHRFVDKAIWADRPPKIGDFVIMIGANRSPEAGRLSDDDKTRIPLADILKAKPELNDYLRLIRGGRKPVARV